MLKLDLILRYELDRLLSRGKNKKVTGLMKNEIKWKSHNKICWINSKNLIDDGREDKKAKGPKKWIITRKLKFEKCKNCLKCLEKEFS